MNPPVVTNESIEQVHDYYRANRGRCRVKSCRMPVLWVSTANGKRIPVDYPDQLTIPKSELTHELVNGWDTEGNLTGIEAWPCRNSKATHRVHKCVAPVETKWPWEEA